MLYNVAGGGGHRTQSLGHATEVFFVWTTPFDVTFIMCIDTSSNIQHTPYDRLATSFDPVYKSSSGKLHKNMNINRN